MQQQRSIRSGVNLFAEVNIPADKCIGIKAYNESKIIMEKINRSYLRL